MSQLRVLEMANNQLTGKIPRDLGKAESLTKILLSGNKLTGSIPAQVLNSKELQVFDVSMNQLKGRIPPHKLTIPASAFSHNLGLCDAPLPPCKHL